MTGKWELKEPNTSPPGACCNQQNLFDPDRGRFIRFPAFSGSHGWQWYHEIYLSNPRRTAPERLKTSIRQPVSPA